MQQEQLLLIIDQKGYCLEIHRCNTCPLTRECGTIEQGTYKIVTKTQQRVKYEHAVNKYIAAYGKESLLEHLM